MADSIQCHRCGWDFGEEHFTDLPEKGKGYRRRESRSIIAIGDVIRCDECYEQELWRSGKHRYSSMTQADMDEWGKHAANIARCMPQLAKFVRNITDKAA